MYFILFITVLVTAIVLVAAAYLIAKLIGPRSYNKVKGEPYECGVPTRGTVLVTYVRRLLPVCHSVSHL